MLVEFPIPKHPQSEMLQNLKLFGAVITTKKFQILEHFEFFIFRLRYSTGKVYTNSPKSQTAAATTTTKNPSKI